MKRLAALVSLIVAAGAIAVAHASTDANNLVGTGVGVNQDTEFTPQVQPLNQSGWRMIGGWNSDTNQVQPGSPIPQSADLFTVRFNTDDTTQHPPGFAAGAICPGGDPTASCSTPLVPVIYGYTYDATVRQGIWQEVYRGTTAGYVAAMSYLPDGRILAVGGDGVYPRRELACSPAAPSGCVDGAGYKDPAGHARAWLYSNGAWSEIAVPPGSGGLTAVACHTTTGATSSVTLPECAAGGLGALWRFRESAFCGTPGAPASCKRQKVPIEVDNLPLADPNQVGVGAPAAPDPRQLFRFRVRRIDIINQNGTFGAVTSGCCAADPADDKPIYIGYQGPEYYADGPLRKPDQFYGKSFTDTPYPTDTTSGSAQVPDYPARPGEPDSAFGLSNTTGSGQNCSQTDPTQEPNCFPASSTIGAIFAPGGPYSPTEPGSTISGSSASVTIWSARLVAGDGYTAGRYGFQGSSGVPDWVVGEQTTTGDGLIVATHLHKSRITDAVQPGNLPNSPGNAVAPQAVPNSLRTFVYHAPTAPLNAIQVINGVGWAVGDRGALLSLSEADVRDSQPNPAPLGAHQPAAVPDLSAYDPYRPLSGGGPATSGVPSLLSQPLESLSGPRLLYGGPPTTVDPQLPPGLAIDPTGNTGYSGTFQLDGGFWSACGDPCSAISNFISRATAVVPTGPGGDFEAVAVGATNTNKFAVAQLKDGRWSYEPASAFPPGLGGDPLSVAFTSPDDGWMLVSNDSLDRRDCETPGTTSCTLSLYHWHGGRWSACTAANGCDPAGVLPSTTGYTQSTSFTTTRPDIPTPTFQLVAAGSRVYLAGARVIANASGTNGQPVSWESYPLILYHDPQGNWTAANGGWDPGRAAAAPSSADSNSGYVTSLSVAQRPDGQYEGWASVRFTGANADFPPSATAETQLLRLAPAANGGWSRYAAVDASNDFALPTAPRTIIPYSTDQQGNERFVMAPDVGPLLQWEPAAQHWSVLGSALTFNRTAPASPPTAEELAPDRRGGFWVEEQFGPGGGGMYHYADRAPQPVFHTVASPLNGPITALAGSSSGVLWAAGPGSTLARHDPQTGWDLVRIPGWDLGGVVTASAPINALAVGPDGRGLAVGSGGRIADLAPNGVVLDDAAGSQPCNLDAPTPPCGTGETLRAVAVGPDGSALAVGDRLSMLWRPAGQGFRSVRPPDTPAATTITAVSMPAPDRAWLGTDRGTIFAGQLSGGTWTWTQEDAVTDPDPDIGDPLTKGFAIRSLAVDATGHGYAAITKGLLQRDGTGSTPWRYVEGARREANNGSPVLHGFSAVALSPSGGPGALAADDLGAVFTELDGRLAPAQTLDPSGATPPPSTVAIVPGPAPGELQAWIGGRDGLEQYDSSPPSDPLTPLPDTPAPRPGEITIAAFGKSDCQASNNGSCPYITGTAASNDQISREIVQAAAERARQTPGPFLGVFTGDISDQSDALAVNTVTGAMQEPALHSWQDVVAAPLAQAGVPLFSAIGHNDLDTLAGGCKNLAGEQTCSNAAAATNLAWRQAMLGAPGAGVGSGTGNGWTFHRVNDGSSGGQPSGSPGSASVSTSNVPLPDTGQGVAQNASVPLGGADTHYAVDVSRNGDPKPVMRLVVVDNSLGSLQASDPGQHPVNGGGQSTWLDGALCYAGTAPGCSRGTTEPATVVAETPTYSYGPGSGSDTAQDAATFETTLLKDHATAVVSGRIGWNALYWALAPGVHCPQPGSSYPDGPPSGPGQCAAQASSASSTATAAAQQLGTTLTGLGAPPPPDPTGTLQSAAGTGLLPFVVASGAGGKLAGSGEGFWHGYTVIRIDPSGNPAATIVEQRPIFDWVNINAQTHVLLPGQHMTLHGTGQEPPASDAAPQYDPINSPAITHRYDLVQADPVRPWAPLRDTTGQYRPLDPSVASINQQTGYVQTGSGSHPTVYAIALLSVGDKVASWPVVFAPRRNFAARPAVALRAAMVTPILLPPAQAAPAHVIPTIPAQPQAPSNPPPTPPEVSSPQLPPLPSVSAPPPIGATTPPAPPPPPAAPPPPPAAPQALPLALQAKLSPIGITSSVVPPSPPPVNPAPPSGSAARKEARQRQAATAKSEEGGGKGATQDQGAGGGQGSGESAMVRRDRVKPGPSFTALQSPAAGHSAWVRDLLDGGGLVLAALVLAGTWSVVRPTPRRRPSTPAPAWQQSGPRRRH